MDAGELYRLLVDTLDRVNEGSGLTDAETLAKAKAISKELRGKAGRAPGEDWVRQMAARPVELFVIKGRGPVATVNEGEYRVGQEIVLRAKVVGVERFDKLMGDGPQVGGLVLSNVGILP